MAGACLKRGRCRRLRGLLGGCGGDAGIAGHCVLLVHGVGVAGARAKGRVRVGHGRKRGGGAEGLAMLGGRRLRTGPSLMRVALVVGSVGHLRYAIARGHPPQVGGIGWLGQGRLGTEGVVLFVGHGRVVVATLVVVGGAEAIRDRGHEVILIRVHGVLVVEDVGVLGRRRRRLLALVAVAASVHRVVPRQPGRPPMDAKGVRALSECSARSGRAPGERVAGCSRGERAWSWSWVLGVWEAQREGWRWRWHWHWHSNQGLRREALARREASRVPRTQVLR